MTVTVEKERGPKLFRCLSLRLPLGQHPDILLRRTLIQECSRYQKLSDDLVRLQSAKSSVVLFNSDGLLLNAAS
jgi:hypothetical protein